MKNKRLPLLLILFLAGFSLHAQTLSPSVVSSSGGQGQGEGLSIAWTLGEIITETFQNDELILTQGFHQTDLVITSIDELPGLDFEISAYPNPASHHVNIGLKDGEYENLRYRLVDFQGREITNGDLEGTLTTVSFSGFRSGVYFLLISRGGQEIKSFKIVKN